MKHRVLVIYTGGTVGMQVTPSGYAPTPGWLSEQLNSLDALQDTTMPDYEVLEYQRLIDSSEALPSDWQKIADDIARRYAHYDGFVVLHGTDTMAYTASALSFLLEGLAKPVIVTGAQVPLGVVISDARTNVVGAVFLAGSCAIPEVCVFFNNRLMRGNRTVKCSAADYMAFTSPNYPELATVGVEIDVNTAAVLALPAAPFQCHQLQSVEIACVRFFPGLSAASLAGVLASPVRALVLETYGAGNAPVRRSDLFDILQAASDRGVVLVNCTQCLHGAVNMDTYAVGSELQKLGVISAHDMTVEAVLTKLMFLLSQHDHPDDVASGMQQNLRGEVTG